MIQGDHLRFVLTEGRKRQIRRMCAQVCAPTRRLNTQREITPRRVHTCPGLFVQHAHTNSRDSSSRVTDNASKTPNQYNMVFPIPLFTLVRDGNCRKVGLEVQAVKRTRIGSLCLGSLRRGYVRSRSDDMVTYEIGMTVIES